jgi:hypothetical protein
MKRPPFGRRPVGAGRASTTANIEMLEGAMLVGPFGDYGRLRSHSRPRWDPTVQPPTRHTGWADRRAKLQATNFEGAEQAAYEREKRRRKASSA